MLEPSIALRGDGQGPLAFTALDKSAPSSDTGLGGAGRSVYVSRLTSGVFAPPVLIHGKCGRRIYGRWVTTKVPTPVSFDPFSDLLVVQPDLLVSFQSTGVTGSREGSGNVVVSVLGQGQEAFTPPQKLFPEGNVRSNSATGFADGTLRAITLNGGLADLSSGLGGGGQASTPFFEAINVALRHDLTVAACQLDDPFAGPGVTLHARVAVENQGLAGTPQNAGGQSVVGLRAIYVADDGSERVVDETPLPQIPAGAHHVVVFTLEMPHDPVGLRVEVFPNPLDARPENDARTCFLGSPAPRDVACTAVTAADEGGTLLPRLTWQNAALYDEVLIYRDGSMIAALPGDTESYVDLSRSPPVIPLVAGAGGLASFQHVYAVRSRTGPSRSRRVESAGCGVSLPPPDIFRRGDSNDDGKVNIADPIHVLNFLFRGGPTPRCQKAADADDSGSLNITDPIFLLGYLFSGGRPPPAPFPACGVDSTGDAISCATQPRCP
jgi:hypothetical protein